VIVSNIFKSIKTRIFLGYAAILLMTLVAATFLSLNNQMIKHDVNAFMENTLPSLQSINHIQSTSKELVLIGFSLYGTTLDLDKFNVKKLQLETAIETQNKLLRTQAHANVTSEITGLYHQLDALAVILSTTNINWDQAREQLNKLIKSADQLNNKLNSLALNLTSMARQKSAEIQQQLNNISLSIMVLIGLMVVISAIAYLLAAKQIAAPMTALSRHLNNISNNCDLTQQLASYSTTEINSTASSINGLLSVFREGMANVRSTIQEIEKAVSQLGHSSEQSGISVDQLQTTIDSLVSVMESLEQHMLENLQRSKNAADSAKQGASSMEAGQKDVSKTANSISELAQDIETTADMLLSLQNAGNQVASVVKTIADIASQTNLLALNAAIEAARAGESGRGFAVVADEVRTLASRTHQSTVEINTILATIVDSIQASVNNMSSNREKAQYSVSLASQLVERLEQEKQLILSLAQESLEAADLASQSQQQVLNVKHQVLEFKQLGNNVSNENQQVASASSILTLQAKNLAETVEQFRT